MVELQQKATAADNCTKKNPRKHHSLRFRLKFKTKTQKLLAGLEPGPTQALAFSANFFG